MADEFPVALGYSAEAPEQSIQHCDVAVMLVRGFLGAAAKKDAALAGTLSIYYEAALNRPSHPEGLTVRERFDAKRDRTRQLQQMSKEIILGFGNDYKKIAPFTEWNAKAAWLADFIAPALAKENYFDIARAIVRNFYEQRKQYWRDHKDEPGFDIYNFKFDASFTPQLNERLFHPQAVRTVYRNIFGNGRVEWTFKSPAEFIAIINQIEQLLTYTPHPTEAKTIGGNMALIGTGNLLRDKIAADQAVKAPDSEMARIVMHAAASENCDTLEQYAQKATDKLAQSFEYLVDINFTPLDENGNIRRFTVPEELETIAHSTRMAARNGPRKFGTFDRSLKNTFDEEIFKKEPEKIYKPQDRLLHFYLRSASWGPDKDGHNGKFSEHRLYEEVIERAQLVELALEDFSELKQAGIIFDHDDYEIVLKRLQNAHEQFTILRNFLDHKKQKSGDIPLTQQEFDTLCLDIDNAFTLQSEKEPFHARDVQKQLLGTLERACEIEGWDVKTKDEKKIAWDKQTKALDSLNLVRDYGPHMLDLEGRNNVDEFDQVIKYILAQPHPKTGKRFAFPPEAPAGASKKKKAKTDAAIAAFLDKLIVKHPEEISARVKAFLARTDLDAIKLRDLETDEATVYHTLKAVQRALQDPDMYRKWVMAEYKGPRNTLALIALQHGFQPELQPSIYPIPLIESLDTLKQLPDYLDQLFFESKAFRRHLWNLADRKKGTIDVEIMFAHSDNTRISGNFASRAALRKAHDQFYRWMEKNDKKLKKLFSEEFGDEGFKPKRYTFRPRPYEGKSESHVSRGGTRARSAMIDAYGLYKFLNETIQGMDAFLWVWFGPVYQRMMSGFYSHAVKAIANLEESVEAKAATELKSSKSSIIRKAAKAYLKAKADSFEEAIQSHNGIQAVERVLIAAGLSTNADFEEHYYNTKTNLRGHAAACPAFNYPASSIIAAGARPPARTAGGVQETTYLFGKDVPKTEAVGLTKIRAIGDVEHQFDMEIHGGWFAAQNYEHNVFKYFHKKKNLLSRAIFQSVVNREAGTKVRLFDHATKSLTTDGAQWLYQKSPMFRETIDFAAYALRMTDLETLEEKYAEAQKRYGMGELAETRAYLDHLVVDACAAATLVMKSFNLDPDLLNEFKDDKRMAVSYARHLLEEHRPNELSLAHLNEELRPKEDISHLAKRAMFEMNMRAWKDKNDNKVDNNRQNSYNLIRRYAWIAREILSHGYSPIASDPPYAFRKRAYLDARAKTKAAMAPAPA